MKTLLFLGLFSVCCLTMEAGKLAALQETGNPGTHPGWSGQGNGKADSSIDGSHAVVENASVDLSIPEEIQAVIDNDAARVMKQIESHAFATMLKRNELILELMARKRQSRLKYGSHMLNDGR